MRESQEIQLRRTAGIKSALVPLATGAAIVIGAAILPGESALRALALVAVSVLPLGIIFTLIGNSLTYAIMHPDRVDACELTRKAKHSTRWDKIDSVEITPDARRIKISYQPWIGGDLYSKYLVSFTIQPRDVPGTAAEIRSRVDSAKAREAAAPQA